MPLNSLTVDIFGYVSFYSGREGIITVGFPLSSANHFLVEVDTTNAFCYQVAAKFYMSLTGVEVGWPSK